MSKLWDKTKELSNETADKTVEMAKDAASATQDASSKASTAVKQAVTQQGISGARDAETGAPGRVGILVAEAAH